MLKFASQEFHSETHDNTLSISHIYVTIYFALTVNSLLNFPKNKDQKSQQNRKTHQLVAMVPVVASSF